MMRGSYFLSDKNVDLDCDDDHPYTMYLIYNCWDLIRPGQSTISGSLMLDKAETEERARELMAVYEARYYESKYRNPDTTTRFVYFWWPHPL